MTIPRGVIWQELRRLGLDAVPHKCRCNATKTYDLGQWLATGAYVVSASTSKSVQIEANANDIGALLFAEAGLLLDHSQEHALQLRHALDAGRWQSPAWSIVTTYYWAFFSALAITRMTGHTPLFITDGDARLLKGLSPSSTSIGAGPLMLSVGGGSSAHMRFIELKRGKRTRVHDTLWATFFSFLRGIVNRPGSAGGTAPEMRLFWPIVRSANILGDDWPSVLRNLVNYAPGLAYGAARNRSPGGLFTGLTARSPISSSDLIERLEGDAAALVTSSAIGDQLSRTTRMLGSLTLALDALANELFEEIAERRAIDRRWDGARVLLRANNWSQFANLEWPIASEAA